MENKLINVKKQIVYFLTDDDFFTIRNVTVDDDFSKIDIKRDILNIEEPLSKLDKFVIDEFFKALENQFDIEMLEKNRDNLKSLEDIVKFITQCIRN